MAPRIHWESHVSLAKWWVGEEVCPVAQLPVYRRFTREERLQLNHLQALRILEQIAFSETFAMQFVSARADTLNDILSAQERARVERVWLEEALHAHLFRRLLDKTNQAMNGQGMPLARKHRGVRTLAKWIGLLPGRFYFLFIFHIALYLEELELHLAMSVRGKKDVDGLHQEVLWYHAKDEATHIATNALLIERLQAELPRWIVWLNRTCFVFVITKVFCGTRSNWRDWKYWVRASPSLGKYSSEVKKEMGMLLGSAAFRSKRLSREVLPQTWAILERANAAQELENFVSGETPLTNRILIGASE